VCAVSGVERLWLSVFVDSGEPPTPHAVTTARKENMLYFMILSLLSRVALLTIGQP
jgi:hypothetical protein